MSLTLQLKYRSAADLKAHLFEHAEQGALLLPLGDVPATIKQYESAELIVLVGGRQHAMQAEVLQLLPGVGIVARLTDLGNVETVAGAAESVAVAQPPRVTLGQPLPPPTHQPGPRTERELAALSEEVAGEGSPADVPGEDEAGVETAAERVARKGPLGASPVAWSFELLLAEWDNLTLAEKIRVARFGKRPARVMILKGLDRTLHIHVLNNPTVSPDEVAMMAAMTNLDPIVLRKIIASTEWLRHTTVVRNLICNPKLPLPEVTKLLRYLPRDQLAQLTKTGKVRGSVKQAIIKLLDRTR